MRLTELEFQDFDLDGVLAQLCEMILNGQQEDPENYGMVAAAIIDSKGNIVPRTSKNNGKWIHAEHAAIDAYKKEFGDIPKGSMCITTLSPCNRPMADRSGVDCAKLLEANGISHVYCGYKDPTQEADLSAETHNSKLRDLCKKFADTFLTKNLNESIEHQLKGFVGLAQKELGLQQLPKIKVVNRVPDADGMTFGRYDPDSNTVYVVARGRHAKDVMRTLGHELVHHKQDIEDRLDITSGETGSNEENEANAMAGVLMRKYNEMNPEPVHENFAGKRRGEAIHSGDVVALRREINRLKSGTPSQRAKGIKLQRQLQTYLNTHKPKNYAVGGTVDE